MDAQAHAPHLLLHPHVTRKQTTSAVKAMSVTNEQLMAVLEEVQATVNDLASQVDSNHTGTMVAVLETQALVGQVGNNLAATDTAASLRPLLIGTLVVACVVLALLLLMAMRSRGRV
jgi:hypothetical protein